MIVPAENQSLPVTDSSIIGGQAFEYAPLGCYKEGDSILWWLNQASGDPATQKKKTDILDGLNSRSCNAQTRMDLGDSADTPLEALVLLTKDENADVRFALAENHNIHRSVLDLLVDDTNPYVAFRAKRTLARLEGAATKVMRVMSLAPQAINYLSA